MKKKYFFIFQYSTGAHLYMYKIKSNGKFYMQHRLEAKCMFNYYQALWYWLLFNLPKFIYKNDKLFGYKHTHGRVRIFKAK